MTKRTPVRVVSIIAVLVLALCWSRQLPAAEMDAETAERLGLIHSVIDELQSTTPDLDEYSRAGRGEVMNRAFVALTGEAVNPLFGVAVLGMYNYIRADEEVRPSLPVYDQPVVWVPLLAIIILMLFNSTLCEAMPWLKVPLNALGDLVNKAGAVAVLPLVVKMFADSVAAPISDYFVRVADLAFPAAYAAEGAGGGGGAWYALAWLAGAAAGLVIYLAVWMTFNVVDVLIMICPFPGLDALLKTFRLSVLGALAGSYHLSPALAFVIAAVVTVCSFFVAGWSFRLSVFGLLYSTDIIFFRRGMFEGLSVFAFSSTGLKRHDGVPMRTLGRLERDERGGLWFAYRPWLVRSERRIGLGNAAAFSAGRGLLNPFVVADGAKDVPWIRLAPRFRGREEELAETFGLRGEVDCGFSGTLRTWLSGFFRGKAATA